jgi:hypothetical protein
LKDKKSQNEKWHPYWNWECFKSGMYDKRKNDMNKIQECAKLLSNADLCRVAMERAILEYPISTQQHLSKTQGRRPWIGAAACCVAIGAIEEEVRVAWNFYMTPEQQSLANEIADYVIAEWERGNA